MAKNFSNPEKEADIEVQGAQRIPNKMNPKRSITRHILIKLSKFKDKKRILKVAREKQLLMNKGTPIRLTADF